LRGAGSAGRYRCSEGAATIERQDEAEQIASDKFGGSPSDDTCDPFEYALSLMDIERMRRTDR